MNITLSISIALAKRQRTQSWLAEQLGTSPSYVSAIKKGQTPSIERLQVIANILGMKLSEFIALGEEE